MKDTTQMELTRSPHTREWSWFLGRDFIANTGDAGADEQRARLYAAAPELLAALEEARDSLLARGQDPSCGLGRMIADAIAKAKGGAK